MQTKILTKVLEELQKPTPDLSYVRGMIETLIDMSGNIPEIVTTPVNYNSKPQFIPGSIITNVDEETNEIVEKYHNGTLGKLNG